MVVEKNKKRKKRRRKNNNKKKKGGRKGVGHMLMRICEEPLHANGGEVHTQIFLFTSLHFHTS